MKDEILEVCKRGSVSFAELDCEVEGFSGDIQLGFGKNIWLWFGLSQEAADTIGDLIKSGDLKMKSCSTMVYAIDGTMPNCKLANQNRNYKDPRWLPVVFDSRKQEH